MNGKSEVPRQKSTYSIPIKITNSCTRAFVKHENYRRIIESSPVTAVSISTKPNVSIGSSANGVGSGWWWYRVVLSLIHSRWPGICKWGSRHTWAVVLRRGFLMLGLSLCVCQLLSGGISHSTGPIMEWWERQRRDHRIAMTFRAVPSRVHHGAGICRDAATLVVVGVGTSEG